MALCDSRRILVWLLFCCCCLLRLLESSAFVYNRSSSASHGTRLHGIELASTHPMSFGSVTSSGDSSCDRDRGESRASQHVDEHDGAAPALKLHLKHRSATDAETAERSEKEALKNFSLRDGLRIQTLFRRITEKKNRHAVSGLGGGAAAATAVQSRTEVGQKETLAKSPELTGTLMAQVESGVTLGSGEYFIDVFVGTPPRRFSLILDTGSDLNWIQCRPCYDCFEQHGPVYDPAASSSYRNVSCGDRRCSLVSSPDPLRPCLAATGQDRACPYFYWYGDHSNTTGDLALETFTMNLTGVGEFRQVNDVIFGCGHWNRGLFHGAAGLLGLGRGQLSFASQLRSLYGNIFSYCLVDRNSDLSVSSKLIFGKDDAIARNPLLNYTTFVAGKDNHVDTFYYVQIKSIIVGGEELSIPPTTWDIAQDSSGGTIVDSGTTLSYFAAPAYERIKEAFAKKVKYPAVTDFPVLDPCYNVSGVGKVEVPEFAILFADGAVWNFPPENYFIRLEPEEIMCLAVLPTPQSPPLSILGNFLQQNFHILYDMNNSRLGFAPTRCAEM